MGDRELAGTAKCSRAGTFLHRKGERKKELGKFQSVGWETGGASS